MFDQLVAVTRGGKMRPGDDRYNLGHGFLVRCDQTRLSSKGSSWSWRSCSKRTKKDAAGWSVLLVDHRGTVRDVYSGTGNWYGFQGLFLLDSLLWGGKLKSLDRGRLYMDYSAPAQAATRKFTLPYDVVSVAAAGRFAPRIRSPTLDLPLGEPLGDPYPGTGGVGRRLVSPTDRNRRDLQHCDVSFTSLYCIVFAWTLAFLVMRRRKPRPSVNRLVKQSGIVACEVLSSA